MKTRNSEPITGTHTVMISDHQSGQMARMIQATALAASKDKNRIAITGMLIEMDAELWQMTATNSYLLITTHIQAPEGSPTGSVNISTEWLTKLSKQMNKSHTETRITFTAETITAQLVANGSVHSTVNHPTNTPGTFPNWRNLWPTPTTERPTYNPVAFNPLFLGTLCKSAAIIANKESASITHEHTDPQKPNTFTMAHDGTIWNALIMPVRQ